MASRRNYKCWETKSQSGKDFNDSYMQVRWSHAAARHARLTSMLENATTAFSTEYIRNWIDQIEQEFPQLKK